MTLAVWLGSLSYCRMNLGPIRCLPDATDDGYNSTVNIWNTSESAVLMIFFSSKYFRTQQNQTLMSNRNRKVYFFSLQVYSVFRDIYPASQWSRRRFLSRKPVRVCPVRQFARGRGGRLWTQFVLCCDVVIVITGYITPNKHFTHIFCDSSYLFSIAWFARKRMMYDRPLSMDRKLAFGSGRSDGIWSLMKHNSLGGFQNLLQAILQNV